MFFRVRVKSAICNGSTLEFSYIYINKTDAVISIQLEDKRLCLLLLMISIRTREV